MKILISGSSGFIGANAASFLRLHGYEVYRLVRIKDSNPDTDIYWNPAEAVLDYRRLEGFEAFINLAGESINALHWSEAKKKEMYDSRIQATRLLCQTAAQCHKPPKKILNASAIGYYGDRGGELLDESAPPGEGFLADLCVNWGAATASAHAASIPVILMRFGVVLSPRGGALKSMLPPFKWGGGGKLGSGNQYMSWIALDDLLHIMLFLLQTDGLKGPVNIVAPEPVTNATFTKTLGSVLHRPTFCSVPEVAVRWIFGEMGQELFLSSTRAIPKKCVDLRYKFLYPNLLEALTAMLQN